MTPTFAADTLEYTATTTNATNKVTATPTDPAATVTIMLGETEVENGSSAEWAAGENELTITVSGGAPDTVYVVTVTKTEEEETT